jgi:geranylgeranyl diphosphate synthase type II
MNYAKTLEDYRILIDKRLDEYMEKNDIPKLLRDSMAYSLCGGGKRLRPAMTLAACDLFNGYRDAALPLACALEMIHTYSLIHDDLPCMDNDDFRRGKPSNHKAFGEATALLAGDALLTYAFEVIADASIIFHKNIPSYLLAAREIASAAGVCGMIAGQSADLTSETGMGDASQKLRYIHTRKTGAMLRAALMAGTYIGSPTDDEAAKISRFGSLYGLLFQITDDVLDVEGSLSALGKTPGKDKEANKLTYPSCYGLENAKRMATDTANEAMEALTCFGEKAWFFTELTKSTLTRKA